MVLPYTYESHTKILGYCILVAKAAWSWNIWTVTIPQQNATKYTVFEIYCTTNFIKEPLLKNQQLAVYSEIDMICLNQNILT